MHYFLSVSGLTFLPTHTCTYPPTHTPTHTHTPTPTPTQTHPIPMHTHIFPPTSMHTHTHAPTHPHTHPYHSACSPGTFQPYDSDSTNLRTCMPCPTNSAASEPAFTVCQCDPGLSRNNSQPEDPCISKQEIATGYLPHSQSYPVCIFWFAPAVTHGVEEQGT